LRVALSTLSPYTTHMIKNDNITGPENREEALRITPELAYGLVKTGLWDLEAFEAWLDHVVSDAEATAIE